MCVCECVCLHVHARVLRVHVRVIQTIHPTQFWIFFHHIATCGNMYKWYICVHRVDQQDVYFFLKKQKNTLTHFVRLRFLQGVF